MAAGTTAVVLGEEDVVILVAVERRVEIDQVNRLVLLVTPEDIQVVAVVKDVFGHLVLLAGRRNDERSRSAFTTRERARQERKAVMGSRLSA
jgi:hypothetical protein